MNTFEKGGAVDIKVWMYLVYLAISIGLTVWVARALSRNGLVFRGRIRQLATHPPLPPAGRLPMAPPIPTPGQAGGPPATPA